MESGSRVILKQTPVHTDICLVAMAPPGNGPSCTREQTKPEFDISANEAAPLHRGNLQLYGRWILL